MDPEGFGGLVGSLFDQLVELKVVFHPLEPLVAGDCVRDADVGSFACFVLAVRGSSYKGVELGTAEAGRDDDGDVEVLAQGFEDVFAEGTEVGNLGVVGGVPETVFVGGG